ncbi:hypothetical protein E2562_002891 [Oryza meyeriana var. granulata]|uniref:hAT-like transposase RNase-H fold domain-containing protein n=1 Tax=Oryza meyeriana var. granulata TaxID=110450 RepID=A0A6G1DDB7_9ORYZ|nr:hypothetical protein E2562_002891 [Oryza meyeriana var. granulata]
MESKNSGKRKNSSAASPSDSTPAGSLLASVQKPPRPEANQPNVSHQGLESENEHFVMPVVSSDSTPTHVTGNSSSQEKEVDGGSTDEGKSGSPRAKRKAKRKKNMGEAILKKFDKYWVEKNNLMVIATILDPRFKMRKKTMKMMSSPYHFQRVLLLATRKVEG